MHHRRVVQEKKLLLDNVKRLKRQISKFEPALKMMRKKYEAAINQTMLTRLAREREKSRVEVLEQQLFPYDQHGRLAALVLVHRDFR